MTARIFGDATSPSANVLQSPSVLDALHLDLEAIAKMTAVARTTREKLASFFRACGLDTPLLSARHEHRGMERFQCGSGLLFYCGNGHGALSRRIIFEIHFKRVLVREQIANATADSRGARSATLDSEHHRVHIVVGGAVQVRSKSWPRVHIGRAI
jgi:hypothetical protein